MRRFSYPEEIQMRTKTQLRAGFDLEDYATTFPSGGSGG